jgi:hypothetical protein
VNRLVVKAEKIFIMFPTEPFPILNVIAFVETVDGKECDREIDKRKHEPYKNPF